MGVMNTWYRWGCKALVKYQEGEDKEHFVVLACRLPKPGILGIFSPQRFVLMHIYVDEVLVQQNGIELMRVGRMSGWQAAYEFAKSEPSQWLGWRFHWSQVSGKPWCEAWIFPSDPGPYLEKSEGEAIGVWEGAMPYPTPYN